MAWPSIPFFFFFRSCCPPLQAREWNPSLRRGKKRERKKRREQIMTLLSYLGRCSRQSLLGHGTSQTFFLLSLKGSPRICQDTQYQHVLWMRVIARDATTTTTTTTIITITTSPDPRPHVPRPTAHGEE
ncbi:hypothetical protein QC764_0034090 [Podospora pseudoanserina]|uniref:Secreted protein n=1 Tax=Podospora pseudoanserina TaxID=2609844 RepID=A0ABR0IHR9_9PEZI|nr:hypothetical protein QC764_0034090 [Podospora pseudoanserina]